MVDGPDGRARTRDPTPADLARIGRSLNEHGARYAVLGGLAVIQHGFARATQDVDLLVDPSPDNVEKIRRALSILADRAVLEVEPGDVAAYTVVRVMDEFCIDLLGQACGQTLAGLADEVEIHTIAGVPIPFLSPRGLLLTKDTCRPKDQVDREFLEALVAASEAP